ncbi:heterokaryon incompatibility Het-C [Armillaria solidipes]|uniref:Heterokaryon incompatibility Het-C n=1 Tax=Armillaria solidipes TaxID=1076256 RepID=A0A2H3BWB5_9AGAR|nr:heterokaryon incompatibility Het-C [Armillaria solidipes]
MSSSTRLLLTIAIILLVLPNVAAFGAGDIPDFSYLNEKAFRHGDIESILENLLKSVGTGGGILGFAKSVMNSEGPKFKKSDVQKVYFGNWLRDYSQAMDIAGLSKLSADTLVLVVAVLGFMTFGYATEEYELTPQRLGVYLPIEHIDNPKGYAEKEGDARQFHPALRPPVDPRELEIDERTGMKNYMATENQEWDSSTAHIRRTFTACIEYGRRAGGEDGPDLWEAYRLLGTGLHTMEDLLAHSNWCEIALRKMGHEEVFCHVGENVCMCVPETGERVPPLVTGTFGSADFMHSMLGEATDHLSQASVTALNDKMSESQDSDVTEKLERLKKVMSVVGGGDDELSHGEELQAQSQAYNFDPDNVAPPEVQEQLLDLLRWRDNVYRKISSIIETMGLDEVLDEMNNALSAYVYTVIAPWLTPILSQVTTVLGEGSKAVIDSDDQYEVFNNPDASDPSHSILSKDHFGLILNEPAGKIAQAVVVHSVELIVQAWSDDSDPNDVIDKILEAFHHPYYANERSQIQSQMFDELRRWVDGLEDAAATMNLLTKESVQEGLNKREGDESVEPGYGGGGGSGRENRGRYGGGEYENPDPIQEQEVEYVEAEEEERENWRYSEESREEERASEPRESDNEEDYRSANGGEDEYGRHSEGYKDESNY